MTKEEIGRIIKESRILSGYTQAQIADFLGRPQNTISAWEMGRAQPDANTLFELFRIFGRSVDEAFKFTVQPYEVSPSEWAIIEKYRQLDEKSQAWVKAVLEHECEITQAQEITCPQKAQEHP